MYLSQVIPALGNSWQLHGVRKAKFAAQQQQQQQHAGGEGGAEAAAADAEAVAALVADAERRQKGEDRDDAVRRRPELQNRDTRTIKS
eukprot:SAG31_NODE_2379_length_5836_cov_4.527453_2_plen_88_part_00